MKFHLQLYHRILEFVINTTEEKFIYGYKTLRKIKPMFHYVTYLFKSSNYTTDI